MLRFCSNSLYCKEQFTLYYCVDHSSIYLNITGFAHGLENVKILLKVFHKMSGRLSSVEMKMRKGFMPEKK